MAKHRSHGEGSIGYMESKKLWVARITLPNGKRIAKYDKDFRQLIIRRDFKTSIGSRTGCKNEPYGDENDDTLFHTTSRKIIDHVLQYMT